MTIRLLTSALIVLVLLMPCRAAMANEQEDIHTAPDPKQVIAPPAPLMDRVRKVLLGTDKNADPSLTLRAPFISQRDLLTPTADAMGLPYGGKEESAARLSEPHRDQDQIAEWLTGRVSEIMTFSGRDWDKHLKGLKSVMTPEALQNYVSFMQDSGIAPTIIQNAKKAHAFVEQKPLLLNKGVVNGSYHWLYEVPANIASLPDTIAEIDEMKVGEEDAIYKYLVRVQVGRAEKPDADDSLPPDLMATIAGVPDDGLEGLVIESWEGRRNVLAR